MDRTTDEIRTALALAVGWTTSEVKPGGYFWCPPGGGRRVAVSALPDFANDLNAMAAVEAELVKKGLPLERYLADVAGIGLKDRPFPVEMTGWNLWRAVTAPAAVRALAAYRVLTAHDTPSRP